MIENEENIKKGKKYLLIGVLILFLAILGSSVAYYLARVQGSLSGRAAGTGLSLTITPLSTSATDDLIPLDNDEETLTMAALGYGNNTNNFDATKSCIDINGYSVCQVYKITLTNNGSVPLTVNGGVELSGANTPNIDCAKMASSTSVTNSNSCIGVSTLANNEVINGNSSNEYFVMVYINNLDEPQYDSGEFGGTVTFTSTDGEQVKGRFTQGDVLVELITKLYNDNKNTKVTNNNIEYQYATSVNLMNDRLGGTTTSLDGGNIRYYGANPNNYIDIGDKTETATESGNWEALFGNSFTTSQECLAGLGITDETTPEEIEELNEAYSSTTGYDTVAEFCSITQAPAGTPILWRIIGVFDGKIRIRRDENIGRYSFDTSASNVNNGNGINEWSQADLMKLLNPGFENNQDDIYNSENDTTTSGYVNNSLYWNSGTGTCYNAKNNSAAACDFTNIGLSDEAKKYAINQTLFLGGFDSTNVFANQAWTVERGNNVWNSTKISNCPNANECNDTVDRTLSWIGKVGLIYLSDFGYAADFRDSNCQGNLSTFANGCTENWMSKGFSFTISPEAVSTSGEILVQNANIGIIYSFSNWSSFPTLLLDSSVMVDKGSDGSKDHPYVLQ